MARVPSYYCWNYVVADGVGEVGDVGGVGDDVYKYSVGGQQSAQLDS